MGHEGLFIAFEGTDGSGKATQFQLLAERLRQNGHDVATFDFPRYDQPSSYFVREYLAGHYGDLEETGPYTVSLFYALDRYEAAAEIRDALSEGKVVLSDRFTGSSMAHQGTKFLHAEQRRGFFIWLDNLEFQVLGIPRPDKSLILHVPVEFSQQIMTDRARERDIHKSEPKHLANATEVYDDLAQLFPKDFSRIDCVRGGKLLTVEQIHDMVWHSIEPLLPEPHKTQHAATKAAPAKHIKQAPKLQEMKPKGRRLKNVSTLLAMHYAQLAETQPASDPSVPYVIPEGLDKLMLTKYQATMDRLFELHTDILGRLKELQKQGDHTGIDPQDITAAILPLAAKTDITLPPDTKGPDDDNELLQALSATHKPLQAFTNRLPTNHSSPSETVVLRHVWPRNELDILPRILYSDSDQPLTEIEKHVSSWPISQKAQALEAYLKGSNKDVLANVTYTWEFLTDIVSLRTFSSAIGIQPSWQSISPRFGYGVPELVEAAGVSEAYEKCFDLSAKLHSVLQEAGLATEAQYAVLAGHRVRWSMTIPGSVNIPEHSLSKHMNETRAEVHPILAQTNFSP